MSSASPKSSEITPKDVWLARRRWIRSGLALGVLGVAGGAGAWWWGDEPEESRPVRHGRPLQGVVKTDYRVDEPLTDYADVTTYNNFLELGPDKESPAERAAYLPTRPWTVRVEGECEAPGSIDIETILKIYPREERIYRFRCVEAWYMVVPWIGFSLSTLLRRFKPTSKAKYVAFESLYDPNDPLPGQRRLRFGWPYREGLRMDEAMHPLTLLATGLYGEELPAQNGAPLRLVVPWKYGFKSIKSVVRIRFTERQPLTSWNHLQPDEYGFYANVNPQVDHPRWSQKRHRVLGRSVFAPKEPTRMFNGYAEEVAGLYKGMDLRKFF